MNVQQMDNAGSLAIKMLRKAKLSMGHPFMLNTKSLPVGQSYLEYPDGIFRIVKISKEDLDYKIIRQLTSEQGNLLRKELNLD